MKTIRIIAIAALFMATFVYVSCSSDNDVPVTTKTVSRHLSGLWQTTHISGYTYDETPDERIINIDEDLALDASQRFLFRPDGTYTSYVYLTSSQEWYGMSSEEYEVSDCHLLFFDRSSKEQTHYEIVSLSGGILTLKYHLEEGDEYVGYVTLHKIG